MTLLPAVLARLLRLLQHAVLALLVLLGHLQLWHLLMIALLPKEPALLQLL
jgi:hypothetical protein